MGIVYVTHGKEWDVHKYLRKERLSDGTYRYYYPYNLPERLQRDINSSYPVDYEDAEYYVYTTGERTKSGREISHEVTHIIKEELWKTVKSMVVNRDLSAAKKFGSTVRGRVGDIEVKSGFIDVTTEIVYDRDHILSGSHDWERYSNSLRYEHNWKKDQYKRDNLARHKEREAKEAEYEKNKHLTIYTTKKSSK